MLNVTKHAKARRIQVRVSFDQQQVMVNLTGTPSAVRFTRADLGENLGRTVWETGGER